MHPNLSNLLPAGVLILTIAGCTTVNTVEPTRPVGVRRAESNQQVITDRSLNHKVRVLGVNTAETSEGRKRIRLEVQNLGHSAQTFFYQIEWIDLQGMPVTTAGHGWTERQILGRETMSLTAVAPNKNCKDYRVKFVEDPRP